MASEVRALAGAGYAVALLALKAPFLSDWRSFHPGIAALLAGGEAVLVPPGSPVKARLACLHHPAVFQAYPAEPLRMQADSAVLVVHHPPVDAAGRSQYDVRAIQRVVGEVLGPVDWAPVGPKVRAAFRGQPLVPPLTGEDWVNVVDPAAYGGARKGPLGAKPVIGRHSRPDVVKWPDTREAFLAAYPDDPDIRVRLLGYGPKLDAVVGQVPANWDIMPFGALSPKRFLSTIDYFSYFHGSDWIEAFGRSILEAMAAGAVCLLPPDFEPLFGEGAVYCEAGEVAARVRAFHESPSDYARQSEQGVATVRERFSPDVAVRRVRDRIGPPQARRAAPAVGRAHRRPRVLYMTSNGVGMGHLTRVLASARRLKAEAEPVVVTMSRALGVVRDEGIMAEFIPHFRSSGMEERRWHPNLRAELTEMLRFYRPHVFVLDGNVPYQGMLDALAGFPELWKIWQRRGMWRPGTGESFVKREDKFHAMIEPGELATALDRGLTAQRRGRTLQVAPITYLRPGEALERDAARTVLGLERDRPAVLLQLGAGNNFRTRDIQARIIEKLQTDVDGQPPQIVLAQWRIGNAEEEPDGVTVLRTFPFARFLAAFDFAVAIAGYNTFHENLAAGLPTLFLSNDHPEQDEQWLRADYARLTGCALSARTRNAYDIARAVYDLSRPGLREELRRACARLPRANGADHVARYLADLAYTRMPHHADAMA